MVGEYKKVKPCVMLSHAQLFEAPWTVACQALLSMEYSKQEYWSRLPFPTSGNLPDPGIRTISFVSPTLAGRFFTSVPPEHTQSFQDPKKECSRVF